MNNERILEIAKRHQDALIGDGNELIGYEFSVASIIAFARAIAKEQMERDAVLAAEYEPDGCEVIAAAIRDQKVEG